jgi:hypothetical protein
MIDRLEQQEYLREVRQTPEPRQEQAQNAQQGIAEEMLRQQTVGTSSRNNQLLQLLASVQPQQELERTAKDQMEQGYLDIRV